MQLMIDIDQGIAEEIVLYERISKDYENTVIDALRNGIPLPEHHGDLVDRDAIEVLRIGIIKREYDKGFDAGVSCMVNRILETPTIIEATEPYKTESEDKE